MFDIIQNYTKDTLHTFTPINNGNSQTAVHKCKVTMERME